MIKYDTASFSLGLGVEKEKEEDRESDDLLLRFRSAIKKHAESLETSNAVDEERPIERQDLSASHAEAEFIELESFAPATRAMNNIKVNESAEGPPPSGKIVPYWMKQCRAITSPLLRLHQEIVSLVELLQPTAEEANDRMSLVSQIQEVAKSLWPHATVTVFGSYATGLYVPTSDVDLVVLDTQVDVLTGLRALANALTRKGVAKGMQVISKAKVPIIKFEAAESGLNVDISFDVPNGPQAAELVKEVIGVWPMLRPLVLIIKLFLQQRELNEVYSGGIGSYALIVMLIAFLQLHTSRRRGATAASTEDRHKRGRGSTKVPASPLEPSLGVLLIDFFRLYGRVIDMKNVGVSATGGGHYFSKEEREGGSWMQEGREFMLSVEDPKDANNDISRNSFNVARVKSAFDFGYQQLSAPSSPEESLLARILRLGPILSSRRRPLNPLVCYRPPGEAEASKSPKSVDTADKVQKEKRKAEGDEGKKRKRIEMDAPSKSPVVVEKERMTGSKKRARSPSPAEDSDAEMTRQGRGRSSSDDDNDDDDDDDDDDEEEEEEDCDMQELRRNATDMKKSSKRRGRREKDKDKKHKRWD